MIHSMRGLSKVLAHGLHHPYDSRLWVIWHSLSPFDWRLHVSASASLSIGLNKEVTYVVVYNMASLTHAHVLGIIHIKRWISRSDLQQPRSDLQQPKVDPLYTWLR